MSKNTLDDILLYSQLNQDGHDAPSEDARPKQTLDDLNAFLEGKFSDRPEILARIENLPGDMEQRSAQSMLNDGKSLDEIADWLEENANKVAYRDAMRSAKSAASDATRTLEEFGWDEKTAQRMGHSAAAGSAFRAKLDEIDSPQHEVQFDDHAHGEIAAIRYHLDIPLEGISLYEAYESMVITDDWSDGLVQEIDVVRHIQEVDAGVEPSQTGFAIELAAKLRAAIDSGADPEMPLEEALQLQDVMTPFEREPLSLTEETRQDLESAQQKAESILNENAPVPPPVFDI